MELLPFGSLIFLIDVIKAREAELVVSEAGSLLGKIKFFNIFLFRCPKTAIMPLP